MQAAQRFWRWTVRRRAGYYEMEFMRYQRGCVSKIIATWRMSRVVKWRDAKRSVVGAQPLQQQQLQHARARAGVHVYGGRARASGASVTPVAPCARSRAHPAAAAARGARGGARDRVLVVAARACGGARPRVIVERVRERRGAERRRRCVRGHRVKVVSLSAVIDLI